jgi:hypothetical protein
MNGGRGLEKSARAVLAAVGIHVGGEHDPTTCDLLDPSMPAWCMRTRLPTSSIHLWRSASAPAPAISVLTLFDKHGWFEDTVSPSNKMSPRCCPPPRRIPARASAVEDGGPVRRCVTARPRVPTLSAASQNVFLWPVSSASTERPRGAGSAMTNNHGMGAWDTRGDGERGEGLSSTRRVDAYFHRVYADFFDNLFVRNTCCIVQKTNFAGCVWYALSLERAREVSSQILKSRGPRLDVVANFASSSTNENVSVRPVALRS